MKTLAKKILVTGGSGYIGSHICVALLHAGHQVVVVDNFHNSSAEALEGVAHITGSAPSLIVGDVRDTQLIRDCLRRHRCAAVIHCAGWKAIGESVAQPWHYYDNNVHGSLSLIRAMEEEGVRTLIFSSTAAMYQASQDQPCRETHPIDPVNPYSQSKRMVEKILEDVVLADSRWAVGILRYFNPVGAHESGLIGESPLHVPHNLMPMLAQVASGQRPRLQIFGADYPTPDGTCQRDYLHVMDLARAHVQALEALTAGETITLNLGTGVPYSVMEVMQAFEKACGRSIPHAFVARRTGDLAAYWADPAEAQRRLGWRATQSLQAMCEDVWRWQCHHQRRVGSS